MSDNTDQEIIKVAKLVSAHGIKGELKLLTYTENPESIFTYPYLFNKNRSLKFAPIRKGRAKGCFIVAIEGITTRTEAETLLNTELYIEAEFLEKLSDGEFYLKDLVGMDLIDASDKLLGKIIAVNNYGAGDLLEYQPQDSKNSEMIPLDGGFVEEVNLEKNFVRLKDFDYS